MPGAAFAAGLQLARLRPRVAAFARRPRWAGSLVAVAGASGGVGQLVVRRLLASVVTDAESAAGRQGCRVTRVRALTRSVRRARASLPEAAALEVVEIPAVGAARPEELRAALAGAAVLVICTGTTAFPTRAWRGGNTPQMVDDRGVRQLVEAVDREAIRRVVLLSSIGTGRPRHFPFVMLNSFGVIDAKRMGERHVEEAARKHGFSYAILRPGRLIGAPHTNVGMLKSEPHPRQLDVKIAKGDCLWGELSRSAAADAVLIAAKWDAAADLDVSLVHVAGSPPHMDKWEALLKKVQTFRQVPKGTRV